MLPAFFTHRACRWTRPYLGSESSLRHKNTTPFPSITRMLGIYIENSSGEPLNVFDLKQRTESVLCATCAICLCWIRVRQETVRVPSLSTEHLSLHADASAQCSNSTADRGRLCWQRLRRQAGGMELEQSTGQATTVFVCTHAIYG